MKSNSYIFFSGELSPESLNGISFSNANLIKYLEQKHTIIINKEIVDFKYHNKFSAIKFIYFLRRLLNVIKKSNSFIFNFFYIVFSNSLFGSIKTLLIIYSFKLFNKKSVVVVHIHRSDLVNVVKKNISNKLIFKLVLFSCDRLIVLSNDLKDFIELTFYFQKKIFCLENTVFNEVFLPKKIKNLKILNCIFISNYIEEKGILVLLEAFKNLGNNFKLNCYGSFTDELLREKIVQFKSENITINGPIYGLDKFTTISNCDLLILPSFNEGKPLVLLESMMLGTPFITSKVGYIKEMVEVDYPFLLDTIDVESIIQLIENYFSLKISDKEFLSKSLMIRYNKYFSNKIYFENIKKIFND